MGHGAKGGGIFFFYYGIVAHTNSIAPTCAGSRQTHVLAPTFSSPHRSQGEAYARVCVVRALK